jgi:ArsR family transcriptional regulator
MNLCCSSAHATTALGHLARAASVRFLQERGESVCYEIVEVLSLTQRIISQHLKVPRETGWIMGETDGPRTSYGLNPDVLKRFLTLWVGSFSSALVEVDAS